MANSKAQVSERAQQIQELVAKGVPKASARAQVKKNLAERDRVIVGKDGKERPAPVGPPLE